MMGDYLFRDGCVFRNIVFEKSGSKHITRTYFSYSYQSVIAWPFSLLHLKPDHWWGREVEMDPLKVGLEAEARMRKIEKKTKNEKQKWMEGIFFTTPSLDRTTNL